MVTCWERAGFLALLCVMFSCVFVIFPYCVLDRVWYSIVSIPDRCILPYFENSVDPDQLASQNRIHPDTA